MNIKLNFAKVAGQQPPFPGGFCVPIDHRNPPKPVASGKYVSTREPSSEP